ncbi:G5 domain-containing protein [Streptococcus pneumoniae]|uniref:pneumococcal collagen-like adhesin PclA n=1 Tax=Streptococcus pneumoniae TaxID=1313 RepID=UPI000E56CBD8|nr:G5 domain-containing protein [Streptococcus pneumoniae]HEW5060580.1 G5 domain-containing protein [Streptococcus pneumoniae]
MKHSHKKSFDWYSMQQRYSIRKYYFGAVSVLLGTALVLGAAASVQTVQAEENKQETTNSISVGRGEAATKPAEVSASNKEKTYAAPTVANPVETTPVKTGEVTKPAEKVEEAKDKKEEVTHQDAIDKSKLLTALSRAKKLESKLYTEASAANLQTSIQAGQSLLGKADASEAELSAAESSIQSSIIGLELRSNSNKGTVSETPVAKKANIVEAKEETKPAVTTTERSAVDSAILPISTAAKVETTSAPASTNEILKPSLSLSDARQNPAIRKEDVDRGYSGFRTAGSGFRAAGSGFRAAGPENKPILNPNNTIAFSDISQGLHSFRGIGHSRGGREIHYDVTTVRRGNRLNFTIKYSGPGEFVNNNFILDKGDGFGNPSNATITSSNPRVREQSKSISQGANYVSHSGYSMTSATSTNTEQTIRFSLPIINPNGDLSVRLKPVTFNVDQGGGGAATSNDPYSNSNYYHRANPLLLDANPYGGTNNKTVSEDIDFQTVYLPTSKLPEGQTRLVREGEKGQRQITYKVHRFGNETLLGLPISNRVTKEAKPRIMQIGVAKELIDTVKPRVDQNKVGDTNNLTFYLDNDGNGVYTEGVDELVQKIAIKDGAKGEKGDQGERGLTGAQGTKGEKGDQGERGLTGAQGAKGEKGEQGLQGRDGQDGAQGQAGRDGKDVLNGKANPEVNQGKDGDKYVNTETGDVFVKNNGNWDKEGNIKGPKGDKGERGEDGKTPEVTVTPGKDGHSTDITFTVPGKDPVTFTVKDGKNGKDGRAPKIKVEDITSPSRIRRDTDAAATPTRNGIRVTVYDDVNDNGVYDEGVDKVLNSKDIYNGIDGRDGSAPTITTKDNGDGTHTITVQNPDSSESTTVVKDGKDGKTANITTTENPDGSHTITVTNPDGSTKETVVKNGKDGKTPKVEVTDNNDGTHTVKVTDGDGNVTNAIIKDGKDGKAATATTTENPDGSHTVTITNPDGTKNEFVVKNGRDGVDGRTPTASVRDNGDGSHTIVITNPEGVTTETTVRDGKSPKVTITDEQNGTHKISVLNGDGTTTETIIKDGKSPVATVRDNQDGTYTIRVENGNGTVSETTVRDGKSPTAKVVDNGDGTHTITVVNSDGTTTTTTVRDGREPKLEVIDNNDGSHTIKVTGADGKGTTTTIFDGKSPKANIVDNGDGTHTLTIVDSDGREYKSIIKDGKDGKDSVSPTVTVKNNNDGTHVVTITNPDGSKTEMVIKDGKDGKCGCQDKPVTPSNDKPVPPTPNVPTPEVPVKPVPAQPTPNVPTPEVPVQPTPAVPTPEVPVKPVPAVPEQPVVPTPAQPATPVNANPVAPTTGKENRGDKLPETGSQSDYISVLLGSGILLSLYVGRRKED